MRDLIHHLKPSSAFSYGIILKDTAGELVDLQGFQSLALHLSWQQLGEGHSKEKSFQILLEEGDSLQEMVPVREGTIYGKNPYQASLIQSDTKNMNLQHLYLGYKGSCRFVRLRAVVAGGSETFVSGIFLRAHSSFSPV